nr:DUF998 domain-containing protein [Actinomadura sp. CNU-125]
MRTLDARGLLLGCGVLTGPLFTAAYLLEGAARADYSAARHPVSSLALGEHGWTQVANFLVAGLLTLAFAAGMWRVPRPVGGPIFGPLLVGVWGVGCSARASSAPTRSAAIPRGRPPASTTRRRASCTTRSR